MARNQATIYASFWSDPASTGLTSGAQRMYFLLLSQPKLSLAGALDVHPKRWAKLAPDTTETDVEAALAELVEARFVVVHDDELVIRSFVAGDLCRGAVNVNLIKGMWSAWAAISSPVLRKVVVDEMSSKAWDREGVTRPNEAEELRSRPRLELPLRPESEPTALCSLLSADCSGSAVPTVDRGSDDPLARIRSQERGSPDAAKRALAGLRAVPDHGTPADQDAPAPGSATPEVGRGTGAVG